MVGLTNALHFIYLLCILSFVSAAPTVSNMRVYTQPYRDLVDVSTHQSRRAGEFTLPPLPYPYDALEPIISKEIMTIHHDKHHQAYVTNLNAALANQTLALAQSDIPKLVELQSKIKFNGGGHINHSLFWKNLAPYGSKFTNVDTQAPLLKAAIEKKWGTFEKFMTQFNNALINLQGSGWVWLTSTEPKGKLHIHSTKDQDPVIDAIPIFGVDMWEHAYYLQYENNKASYVSGIWKVINWHEAEDRFKNGVEGLDL